MTGPDHCEACGSPIPQLPGAGRPRRFCDAACRQRAQRERWAALIGFLGAGPELLPELDDSLSDEQLGMPANADQAVLEVISEALVLVVKLDRVATRARPEFQSHIRRTRAALARQLERWSGAPLDTLSASRESAHTAHGDEPVTI